MRLLHAEDTPFQHLAVYEHDILGRVLVLDGIIQATTADEFIYHEMFVHVPMLGSHLADEDRHSIEVLIIGGGDGGILREVLRHEAVGRAVMVEIDEAVIRVSQRFLGINGDYDDPRVELIVDDAYQYLASPSSSRFDLILIDATDPVGPGEILYDESFYRLLSGRLKPRGIVVRHLGLPFLYPEIFRSGAERLQRTFHNVQPYRTTIPTYICGEMAFAAASMSGESIASPRKSFEARFYNPEIHRAAFAMPTHWRELLPGGDRRNSG